MSLRFSNAIFLLALLAALFAPRAVILAQVDGTAGAESETVIEADTPGRGSGAPVGEAATPAGETLTFGATSGAGPAASCYELRYPLGFGYAGNSADDVAALKQVLAAEGLLSASDLSEPSFTEDTAQALSAFQRRYGLPVSGFADTATRAALSARSGCALTLPAGAASLPPTAPAVSPATGYRVRATGGAGNKPGEEINPEGGGAPSAGGHGEIPPPAGAELTYGFKLAPPPPPPPPTTVPRQAEGGVVTKVTVPVFPVFLSRVRDVLDKVIPFIVGLAVFFILWQIFIYITRAADEEKRAEARLFIVYGIIGVFFMLSIWGLVNILATTLGPLNQAVSAGDIPKVPVLAP